MVEMNIESEKNVNSVATTKNVVEVLVCVYNSGNDRSQVQQ